MDTPPITLCHPTYIVAFAIVGDTVEYMNRRNRNIGGGWLGAVPKLAICKDMEDNEFYLAHCDDEWNVLCLEEFGKQLNDDDT